MLRRIWLVGLVLLILTGCDVEETLETVSDVYVQAVSAKLQQIVVSLPVDATVTTMQSETDGTLYLCDGYSIIVQTREAGNLDSTLRAITGFGAEQLQPIASFRGNTKRYDCVWTAAGEAENQIGRTCVLDDGSFHYSISVMAGESCAAELQHTWQELFDSFRLVDPSVAFNTGS